LAAERALAEPGVDVAGHRDRLAGGERRAAAAPAPQEPLRHRQRGAPAGRADPLVVLRRAAGDLVAVAEPALDLDQILDVHARGERVAAAAAARGLGGAADVLVEADAELGGPLE